MDVVKRNPDVDDEGLRVVCKVVCVGWEDCGIRGRVGGCDRVVELVDLMSRYFLIVGVRGAVNLRWIDPS
jgi:hypothetical protein